MICCAYWVSTIPSPKTQRAAENMTRLPPTRARERKIRTGTRGWADRFWFTTNRAPRITKPHSGHRTVGWSQLAPGAWLIAYTSSRSAPPTVSAPLRLILDPNRSLERARTTGLMAKIATPIGTLRKKIDRQPSHWTNGPPMRAPAEPPAAVTAPAMAKALPRSASENVLTRIAISAGAIAAADTP